MKVLLQILFLLITSVAPAQFDTLHPQSSVRNTDFYHLKMPGGNEQNSINQFLQDGDGRLWIATKDGLVCYNGKKMSVYRSDADNPHSIGDNFVTRLFLDKEDRLWAGTQKGLWRYRPATDDFVPAHPDLNGEYITDLVQDADSTLWIVNHRKNRLWRYDADSAKLQLVVDDDLQNDQGKPQLLWLLIDTKGRFFITDMNYGFIRFFPETRTFRRYRLIDDGTAKRYYRKMWNLVTRIIPDRDDPDLLWIGTNLGYLTGYDLRSSRQTRLVYNTRLTNHGFYCYNSDLYEDDRRNIWITTWFYGTFRILPGRRSYEHYLPDPENKHSISNTITTAIYQDRAGYLWFGTEYQGADILKKNKKFYVFPTYPPRKDALPPAHYLTITKDRHDRIWVGAEGGIYQVDKNSLKSTKVNALFGGAERFFCLFRDGDNRLWAGTERGVYCLDENGKILRHLTYKKDDYQSISCNYISDLRADRRDNIWIGTFCAGVVRYNTKSGRFYRFTPDKSDPKSISHPYITRIFVDKEDQVWVGTPDGLNRLNAAAGNFTIYRNDKSDPATISSSVINDITETGDTLWIATQGGGLNLFDKSSGTFRSFTVKEGLPDNNVEAILTDDHGNLWLSTTKHIVRFDPRSGEMVTYTESDGLENRLYVENMGWQTLNFGSALAYKDEEGYLYFGGTGGLLFFHPDSLPVNTYRSQLIIERFRVNGKDHQVNGDKIVLRPDENQLEIGFTLMNLIQSRKNRYAWKLEPYDTQWHQGDYLSKAAYFSLPPGKYRLLYKAANNDGIWTVAPRPLEIWIKPRFYQTTGFLFLMIALILLLFFIFLAYRRYLKRQMEKKRRMMRYSWSHLDEAEARKINEKLLSVMQDRNIFLDPDLSLNKLANILEIKPNYLSQTINQFHEQNFFEFINTFRIREAKRLLCKTTMKVVAVAYDAGFNSLSTFNSVFKKATGTTPSRFRKSCPENTGDRNSQAASRR